MRPITSAPSRWLLPAVDECAVPSALPAKRRRYVAFEGTTQLKGSTSDACARARRRRSEGRPQKAQEAHKPQKPCRGQGFLQRHQKDGPRAQQARAQGQAARDARRRRAAAAPRERRARAPEASPLTREGAAAPAKLRKRRSLKGHFGKVVSVSWLPDSNRLATAAQDGNVIIWHAPTGEKTIAPSKEPVGHVRGLRPRFFKIMRDRRLDNVCTVWTLPDANEDAKTPRVLEGHKGHVAAAVPR